MKLVLDNKIYCIHPFIGLELSVPDEFRLIGMRTELHAAKIVLYLFHFGAFAKLRKATLSFVTTLRLYVRIKQLGCYWKDFREVYIQFFSENLSRKFNFH